MCRQHDDRVIPSLLLHRLLRSGLRKKNTSRREEGVSTEERGPDEISKLIKTLEIGARRVTSEINDILRRWQNKFVESNGGSHIDLAHARESWYLLVRVCWWVGETPMQPP